MARKRTGRPNGRPRKNPPKEKRPMGGPLIREIGEATRFKKGEKKKKPPFNPMLFRKNLTYLSLQEIKIDENNVATSAATAMQKLAFDAQGRTNPARLLAARMLERAIAKAEPEMCKTIITQTEGNLIEKVKNVGDGENDAHLTKAVTDSLVKSREKALEEEF